MKIVIPIFDLRISPRFDCTLELLLADIADGRIVGQQKVSTKELSLIEKLRIVLDMNVDIMICGGIDCYSMWRLRHHGVVIFAWLAGDVQEILSCFLACKSMLQFKMEQSDDNHEYQEMTQWQNDVLHYGKEIMKMPRKDWTGHKGSGAMTGRASGFCAGDQNPNAPGRDMGQGECRQNRFGSGRGGCRRTGWDEYAYPANPQTEYDFLTQRKEMLQNQLNIIMQRLNEFASHDVKEE